MNEHRCFTDRELANRYVRSLGLMGFTEQENTPNAHGGRMVVYRGKQGELGVPAGGTFLVLLILSIVGLAIWVLWRVVASDRVVLRTVIYRPAGDPARDEAFEQMAANTARLPEVKRLVAA